MKSCPVCRLFLQPQDWRGHTVLVCTSCGGVWLGAETAQRAVADDADHLGELASIAPGVSSSSTFEGLMQLCPDCPTAQLQVVTDAGFDGEVARCTKCGGIWRTGGAAAPASPPQAPAPSEPTLAAITPAPRELPSAPAPAYSAPVPQAHVEIPEPPCTTAEDAWKRLVDGNARFAADMARRPRCTTARAVEVLAGQEPFAVVVCCSDSRVPPEIVFDQGIGDLFVVRTAGHVVMTSVQAGVLYAVDHLDAPLVLVLGHTDCGAVKSTLAHAEQGAPYAEPLTRAIQPAAEIAKAMRGDHATNTARVHAARTAEALQGAIATKLHGHAPGARVIAAMYHLGTRLVERLPDIEPPLPTPAPTQPEAAAPAPPRPGAAQPARGAVAAPDAAVGPPGDATESRHPRWCPKCRAGFDETTAFCTRCGVLLVQPWYRVPCLRCKKENLIGLERCWNCRSELHPDWLASGKRRPGPPTVAIGRAAPGSSQNTTGCGTSALLLVGLATALLALLSTVV